MTKVKEGRTKKRSKPLASEAGDVQTKQNADNAENRSDHPSEPGPMAPEAATPAAKQQKLASPYRVVFKSVAAGFELGEDSQYRQRVFRFYEKPGDEVIGALKENGFTYRPQRKAWTLKADYSSRAISDKLARQFADATISRDR